jgi:hypothetical protein
MSKLLSHIFSEKGSLKAIGLENCLCEWSIVRAGKLTYPIQYFGKNHAKAFLVYL